MTSRGDIILLGRHRLMCGDSSDEADVARLLDGAEPRVMIADPPFIDNLDEPEPREHSLRRYTRHKDWRRTFELSPSQVAYVWGTGGPRAVVYYAGLEAGGYEVRHACIWDKTRPVLNQGKHAYQHEICWYATRPGATMGWIGPRLLSTVWAYPPLPHNKRDGHPHSKPVELWQIPLGVHEGDLYEPFAGSSPGLIAAERLGRTCYAMELNPDYCDLIVKRWEASGVQRALSI